MEKKIKIHKRLTKEELRKYKGLEVVTDEEAEHIICTLESLSILYYSLYKKHRAMIENNKEQRKGENDYEYKQAA